MSYLTHVRALTISIEAISCRQTGLPTLDHFNLIEVDKAGKTLRDLELIFKAPAERDALQCARCVLANLACRLEGWRGRNRRLSDKRLEQAAALLPGMLRQAIDREGEYWRAFAAWAVGEAERICEVES